MGRQRILNYDTTVFIRSRRQGCCVVPAVVIELEAYKQDQSYFPRKKVSNPTTSAAAPPSWSQIASSVGFPENSLVKPELNESAALNPYPRRITPITIKTMPKVFLFMVAFMGVRELNGSGLEIMRVCCLVNPLSFNYFEIRN